MSKSNDRGKVILDALLRISQLDDAAEMKRIALSALVAIGVLRVMQEESLIVRPS